MLEGVVIKNGTFSQAITCDYKKINSVEQNPKTFRRSECGKSRQAGQAGGASAASHYRPVRQAERVAASFQRAQRLQYSDEVLARQQQPT